ncbi:M23 family metallopeptidase [Micromonospora sp. DT81.3]|uniref:M23 family metallopeptidase n=1 Tax=Micromonospora sp. DT81.3 TaxID=3416523 RepID=UPI003CF145BD
MPTAPPIGGDSTSRSGLRKRSTGTVPTVQAGWNRPAETPSVPAPRVIVEAATPALAPAAAVTRRSSRAQAFTAPSAQAAAPTVDPVREAVHEAADEFELREPEVLPEPEVLVETAAEAEIDEFAHAAKLFSFTGETRVIPPVEAEVAPPVAAPSAPRVAPTSARNRGASFRRIATASFSVGVMGIVGLLTVGMTTPAQAVAAARSTVDGTMSIAPSQNPTQVSKETEEIQAYVAPAEVANAELDRTEGYSAVSLAEIAAESGINYTSSVFTNDQNSPIQWPFAVGVGLSSGFGQRWGRMHEGLDFTPGEGAPIQAIADGTVRIATESGGAYGVTVYIDHVIDGQLITSHYAHMQYGSLEVSEGEQVTVGTIVGHTGNTGRSYGAHLHFELLVNGTTPIDPLPWLRAHAGG